MAETYGEGWIETARDKLYDLLNALKTTMASGYDPTFTYLYRRHTVADLRLNAVTIDLAEGTPSGESWETDVANRYLLNFSIRVHTDYDDGYSDGEKQARLVNSIVNKLKANYNLGGSYLLNNISDLSVNQTFSESHTFGGQVVAIVEVNIAHTQE